MQYKQKMVKTFCTTELFHALKVLAGIKPELLTI